MDFANMLTDGPDKLTAISAGEITALEKGQKVWYEDELGQGNGRIHYIPSADELKNIIVLYGEPAISVKPTGTSRARFIPISQIILSHG